MLPAVKFFAHAYSRKRMRLVEPMRHTVADPRQHRRAMVRLVLGMLQMGGTVVSLVLLSLTGVSAVALAAAVGTCMLTTISVLLFGARKGGPR